MSTGADPSFIRGGQAAIHFIRMGKQVIKWAIGIGLVFGAFYLTIRAYYWTASYDWYLYSQYYFAKFVAILANDPHQEFSYADENGDLIAVPVSTFLADPLVLAHAEAMWSICLSWGWQTLFIVFVIVGIILLFCQQVGVGLASSDRVRGSVLVDAKDLQRLIELKWRDWRKERGKSREEEYRYSIAGVDFPPDAPMVHTQMIGTPGSGKTVAMKELLDQIRERGDQVVVYDRMGAFIREYYDAATDHILNPFDARDAGWSPFADADSGPGFAAMAEAMIPPPKNVSDPFWANAARSVFRSLAEALSRGGRANVEELSKLILKSDLETMAEALKDTPGGAMMDLSSPKTAQSVRTSVVEPLEFLMYLRHREAAFSIGDWVRSEAPGVLFLSGQVEHAAATRNLISAAIEIAANATMTCGPSDKPRIWFFIDELPSLNYLPCLDRSLAEIRQFGGCFVLGYQVFAKLRDVYGDRVAEAISGTVNNSFIFTTPDEPTAKRCSLALGMEDITEKAEGMSIGANEARDGVTFQHKRIERAIATASEIMDLPRLTCFARFAYDTPRARLTLEYKKRPERARAFEPPTEENERKFAPDGGPRPSEAWSPEGTFHDDDGVVIDHDPDRKRQPRRGRNDVETIDIAALPVPRPMTKIDPYRKAPGEERFAVEADLWFIKLCGPISAKTGKPERAFSDAHRRCLLDHFIVERLRGVSASEIGELEPDASPPADPAERAAWRERLDENAALLSAFLKREEQRAEKAIREAKFREKGRDEPRGDRGRPRQAASRAEANEREERADRFEAEAAKKMENAMAKDGDKVDAEKKPNGDEQGRAGGGETGEQERAADVERAAPTKPRARKISDNSARL